jgi:hypothetical protein
MLTLVAEEGPSLDLYKLTQAAQAQGLRTPLLFRFLPIVGHRIDKLNVSITWRAWQLVQCGPDKQLMQRRRMHALHALR